MIGNEIGKSIVEAAIEAHRELGGPRLLVLVANFSERFVKNGIHRVVNGLFEDVDLLD